VTSSELENLVRIGQLKMEPPSTAELSGLQRSGERRLNDAANTGLALESRFDLAYNAVHALALAGLRRLGYRPENRFVVFQALPHSLRIATPIWRVLAKCHGIRNQAEYEGFMAIDERLLTDLINAAGVVREALRKESGHP